MAQKADKDKIIAEIANDLGQENGETYNAFFTSFPPPELPSSIVPYYKNFNDVAAYGTNYGKVNEAVKNVFMESDEKIQSLSINTSIPEKIAAMGQQLIDIGGREKQREQQLIKKAISKIKEQIPKDNNDNEIAQLNEQIKQIEEKINQKHSLDYQEINLSINLLMQGIQAYQARLHRLTVVQNPKKNRSQGENNLEKTFTRLGELDQSIIAFIKGERDELETTINQEIGLAAREALIQKLQSNPKSVVQFQRIDITIALLAMMKVRQNEEIRRFRKEVGNYETLKKELEIEMDNLYKRQSEVDSIATFLPQDFSALTGIESLQELQNFLINNKGTIQLEAYSEIFPTFFHNCIAKSLRVGPQNLGNDAIYILNFSATRSSVQKIFDEYENAIITANNAFNAARTNRDKYLQGLKRWQTAQKDANARLSQKLRKKGVSLQDVFIMQISDKYYKEIDSGKLKGTFQGRGITGEGAIDTLEYLTGTDFSDLLPALRLIMANTAANQPFHSSDEQSKYRIYLQTIFTTVAALFMFDDFYSNLAEQAFENIQKMNNAIQHIHLYIINGIYFSSGQLLEATGKALIDAARNPSMNLNVRRFPGTIQATASPGDRYTYFKLAVTHDELKNNGVLIPPSYKDQLIGEALTHNKIQITFFAGFARVIDELYGFSFSQVIKNLSRS